MLASGGSTSANNGVGGYTVESGISGPATITIACAAEDETGAPGTLANADADTRHKQGVSSKTI
jgi:hypothetical protein